MSSAIKYIEEQELQINDLTDKVNELEDQIDRYRRYGSYADLELSPLTAKIVLGCYVVFVIAIIYGAI